MWEPLPCGDPPSDPAATKSPHGSGSHIQKLIIREALGIVKMPLASAEWTVCEPRRNRFQRFRRGNSPTKVPTVLPPRERQTKPLETVCLHPLSGAPR